VTIRALFALCLCLSAVGCSSGPVDPEAEPSQYAARLSTIDAAAIVDLVNYPGTTLDVLDHAVGLDSRAAQGIVAARDGADGTAPSADDVPFADIGAIDAVPYVGDAAFAKLDAYAAAHPAPRGETVEGVTFAGWESQSVVYGVDHATLADLDALLDDRAAEALFDHRPYTTVAAMGPEAYVGLTALTQLRGHARAWWAAMNAQPPSLAGTFDGVTFNDHDATIALAIADEARISQLEAHDVKSSPATTLVSNRPYATLAAVAATNGIGQATMHAILVYAQSGTWVSPVTGYTLDAAELAAETGLLKDQLTDDEGFAEYVLTLAQADDNEAITIMNALMAQIDELSAPLLGNVYVNKGAADVAIDAAAPVKELTKSGGWTYLASIGVAQPGTCQATFANAVSPHLADVLFLSESDRPLSVVAYPGAGTSAPTAASVLALVGAPSGSTALLRDPANFYNNLEPSSGTADPSAASAIQSAFTSQLTDVVYVAVFPGGPSAVEVQVYLVGRTSCGDLVGLTSISIET
jgi:hypothetical protein